MSGLSYFAAKMAKKSSRQVLKVLYCWLVSSASVSLLIKGPVLRNSLLPTDIIISSTQCFTLSKHCMHAIWYLLINSYISYLKIKKKKKSKINDIWYCWLLYNTCKLSFCFLQEAWVSWVPFLKSDIHIAVSDLQQKGNEQWWKW